jgi:hypothetical protein
MRSKLTGEFLEWKNLFSFYLFKCVNETQQKQWQQLSLSRYFHSNGTFIISSDLAFGDLHGKENENLNKLVKKEGIGKAKKMKISIKGFLNFFFSFFSRMYKIFTIENST